ncbi:histidine kinase [Klebsiella pneumoniae]|uniref:Histidine kinase n=1 Tax=Klebsiella pneumoniae TaxID=573 RepID=A0A377ZPF3_KLEPN|nr:histidine kinase [Klebsiella pneumoniae]
MFILLSALLALAITGCAGWYIYRNLGSNLTAISRAMSRLAQGEPNVSVPALQRRDELGELARAFNVFRPQYGVAGAHHPAAEREDQPDGDRSD